MIKLTEEQIEKIQEISPYFLQNAEKLSIDLPEMLGRWLIDVSNYDPYIINSETSINNERDTIKIGRIARIILDGLDLVERDNFDK